MIEFLWTFEYKWIVECNALTQTWRRRFNRIRHMLKVTWKYVKSVTHISNIEIKWLLITSLLSLPVYVSPRLGNLVLLASISRRKECYEFVTYLCTVCFAIYSIQLKMRWFLQYLFAHIVLLYEPQYACFESDFASKPSKQNHVKSGIDIITTCIQNIK